MPRRLRYIAQPFFNGRAAEPYTFRCAVDAEEGGYILMSQASGVLVYQQWFDDETGPDDDPEVLLTLGDLPDGLLSIDPPGPDPWETQAA